MKIKKIEKAFNKMVKEEIGPDGYVAINKIVIFPKPDGLIDVEGTFGELGSNGKVNWNEPFKLEYADGKSLEFLKGMFYKELEKVF